MRRFLAGLFMVVTPAFAVAEPVDALRPMAFLAGQCWKGLMPDGKQTDEHCFEWLYSGKVLRDRHIVRAPGKPDYMGETVYYWDSEAKQIQYLYYENLGGISRGVAEPASDGMVFPEARYIADGKVTVYRSRWTRLDPNTYESANEFKGKDGWFTAFKIRFQAQPK